MIVDMILVPNDLAADFAAVSMITVASLFG